MLLSKHGQTAAPVAKDACKLLHSGVCSMLCAIASQDKYGRPVYIELLGVTDCVKMLQVTPQEQIMHYHIFTWVNRV